MIIVGEEIKTTHGELIAYYVKEEVPPGLSPQETIRRLREQGAVVAIPHPLDSLRNSAMGMANVMEVIDQVDAIEVRNARCVRPQDNLAALKLAQEHGLLETAGSDAHIPFELGYCYVEMPEFEDDAESFMDALQSAKPMGKESPFWPHLFSTWAKWRKRIKPVPYGGGASFVWVAWEVVKTVESCQRPCSRARGSRSGMAASTTGRRASPVRAWACGRILRLHRIGPTAADP